VQRVFRSTDGQAFETLVAHTTPAGESSGAIFSTLALDSEGNLYLAFAQTQGGAMHTLLVTSQDGGTTWSTPVQVSEAGTTTVFPWVVAGSPGRVAVGTYRANGSFLPDQADASAAWHPYVAFSTDALSPAPHFAHVQMADPPNHLGPICTGGTSCDPQFRRLGDFFELAMLHDGRVAMVYVDDTGQERVNAVAVQRGGPGLL
jgi:hypothetical protein